MFFDLIGCGMVAYPDWLARLLHTAPLGLYIMLPFTLAATHVSVPAVCYEPFVIIHSCLHSWFVALWGRAACPSRAPSRCWLPALASSCGRHGPSLPASTPLCLRAAAPVA